MNTTLNEERVARAALCHLHKPGDPRIHALIDHHGAAWAWAALGSNPDLAHLTATISADDVLRRWLADGGRLVCPGDDEWPSSMSALRVSGRFSGSAQDAGEPFALWVRGNGHLGRLCESAISIVGSRASTDYGNFVAGEFAAGLAGQGWTVISGGAFGIDAAAHRGALVVGGPTIAVLAGGADVAYPRAHEVLFNRITQGGCIVSEEPPGQGVRRERFLSRNRLIAAMGRATVLVEAGLRSGALNTARHAQRILRDVLAVPGPVTSAMSAGCHAQLREGYARLVTSADDVVTELGPIQVDEPPLGPRTLRDGVGRTARIILDAFPVDGCASPAELAVSCGVPVATVANELESLIEAGLVELGADGLRLAERARTEGTHGEVA